MEVLEPQYDERPAFKVVDVPSVPLTTCSARSPSPELVEVDVIESKQSWDEDVIELEPVKVMRSVARLPSPELVEVHMKESWHEDVIELQPVKAVCAARADSPELIAEYQYDMIEEREMEPLPVYKLARAESPVMQLARADSPVLIAERQYDIIEEREAEHLPVYKLARAESPVMQLARAESPVMMKEEVKSLPILELAREEIPVMKLERAESPVMLIKEVEPLPILELARDESPIMELERAESPIMLIKEVEPLPILELARAESPVMLIEERQVEPLPKLALARPESPVMLVDAEKCIEIDEIVQPIQRRLSPISVESLEMKDEIPFDDPYADYLMSAKDESLELDESPYEDVRGMPAASPEKLQRYKEDEDEDSYAFLPPRQPTMMRQITTESEDDYEPVAGLLPPPVGEAAPHPQLPLADMGGIAGGESDYAALPIGGSPKLVTPPSRAAAGAPPPTRPSRGRAAAGAPPPPRPSRGRAAARAPPPPRPSRGRGRGRAASRGRAAAGAPPPLSPPGAAVGAPPPPPPPPGAAVGAPAPPGAAVEAPAPPPPGADLGSLLGVAAGAFTFGISLSLPGAAVGRAAVGRAAGAPPPPSPPGTTVGVLPPPPPPGAGAGAPPPADTAKLVDAPTPQPSSAKSQSRSSLLDSIQKGVVLKKSEPKQVPSDQGTTVPSALANIMDRHEISVDGELSAEDEDEEWEVDRISGEPEKEADTELISDSTEEKELDIREHAISDLQDQADELSLDAAEFSMKAKAVKKKSGLPRFRLGAPAKAKVDVRKMEQKKKKEKTRKEEPAAPLTKIPNARKGKPQLDSSNIEKMLKLMEQVSLIFFK